MLFIGGALIVLLSASFIVVGALASSNIQHDLDYQLKNQIDAITSQISDLVTTSARSYLMAVGEQSNSTALEYYDYILTGSETKEEALSIVANYLTSVKFMNSGYVYLTDRAGIIVAHPNKDIVGTKSSIQSWLTSLSEDEALYHAYEYKGRNKLLYRVFNKEFGINICASAYTSDFFQAVDKEDFNTSIQKIKIGKTGYPFIMTKSGIILSHQNKSMINKNGNHSAI